MSDAQKIQPAVSPPVGYNPIAEIRGAYFHWLLVPFFADRGGKSVWCKCRCLNAMQIKACGDIMSLILPGEKQKKSSPEDLIRLYNAMEKVCAAVLVSPSFDEIIADLTGQDCRIQEKKKQLADLEKEIDSDKKMKAEEKAKLQKEIDRLNQEIGFLLPDDTMGFLTGWALGTDITDINKISREMLLTAAQLARAGSRSPHDYLSGIFTDKHMEEIDLKAWGLLAEFDEDKKRELELSKKGRVIRGTRKTK